MDTSRVRSVIVFLVFVFALAVVRSEANRKILGTLLGNGVPWISRHLDPHTAQQLWIHCRKEMEGNTEAVDFFYLLHAEIGSNNNINSDVVLLLKRKLGEAISDLPPQAKEILLDCFRRNNYPLLHASAHEAEYSRTRFNKFLKLLYGWSDVPRRYLKTFRSHPAPDPGPAATSPAYAPTPSDSSPSPAPSFLVPVSSPSPAPSFLSPGSSPSPTLQPPAKAPELPSLSEKVNFSPPPPKVKRPSPHPVQHHPPQDNSTAGNQKYIIIAITSATAVALLALVALLFFCCLKRNDNKVDPKDGQRDDDPLLNICSRGLKSHTCNKDFKTTAVALNNLAVDTSSQVQLAQSSEATGVASLPLPPGVTAPPPPGPPPPPPKPPAPSRPPPPPRAVRPPPVPLTKSLPGGPHHRGRSSSGGGDDLTADSDTQKTKLKPFFWDKVLPNPDHTMVWHGLKAGSFQVNEEKMETLFGYASIDKNKNEHQKDLSSFDAPKQYIQIIDLKKSQNLAILLKALNVTTEEVCDALKEGNELPPDLIQTLIKMAPTTEEELKLRLYNGDLSQLGPAERFLKVMVEIPFAFKRLESLLFMGSLQDDVSSIKESFETLEVACKELKNSRLFLKLLEAVLKTGNRMNDGTFRGGAQAFKLDTLLKLSDVKGIDGKTTLLHFVVQEIIRSEGIRAACTARESHSMSSLITEDLAEDSANDTAEYYCSLGLQVVSGLSNDLENVSKAAVIDGDTLTATVSKLGCSLLKSKEFLNDEMKSSDSEEESEFHDTLSNFVQHAEEEITWLLEEEKRIMALVKSTADYFHGNAGKEEGLRLFVVVRDFLIILDKTCNEVRNSATMRTRIPRRETSLPSVSSESHLPAMPDVRQLLFPAIQGRRVDDSCSDDESFSP